MEVDHDDDAPRKRAAVLLREMIAAHEEEPWAHLRLGDVYALRLWRRDAYREWGIALDQKGTLRSDHAFRKNVCEVIDSAHRAWARDFVAHYFGPSGVAPLLEGCIRSATEVERIESAIQLLEAVAGPQSEMRGMASLRELEVAKTCSQKKNAIAGLVSVRYTRARDALSRLERARREQGKHPTTAFSCLGSAIAEALAQIR
jgi:hypothetical protein